MTCDTSHGWVKPRADGARARCGGPDICPTCQTEKMHDSMLTACFGPCSNSSPEHDHAAAAAVARDAARYRLLRRGQHWSVINGIGDDLRAEALDAAIDFAISGRPQSKGAA
jgi:hypothetical protein